ncbi:unnamed protein product [Rotaria sp. Silwood1]|nr:unnamed protein product [Rotaria sp. Silwood1]CAF3497692.1 unnamed protein product [Rotaria sp. Silwood1]CAF4718086.1 unnamed protein product [Rotaria sp. Silwood1]
MKRKNLLSSDKVVYFTVSSETTGKPKHIPVTTAMLKRTTKMLLIRTTAVWRPFPISSYPTAEQRFFTFETGKKSNIFLRSKDGTPIGPLTQFTSAVNLFPGMKQFASSSAVNDLTLIEGISDYETSTFVQLVFALTAANIVYYSVPFASDLLHSVKIIENHFEETCLCITSSDFYHSSFVRQNIPDVKFRTTLNPDLENMALEYGGLSYRSEQVNHIRKECLKKNYLGLLHRL